MLVSIKVVLFFLWLFQVFIQHSGSSNIRLDEFALVFHFEDSSCKTMDRSSDTRHKYVGIPPPLDPFVGAGALVHRPYGMCRLFQRETGRERAES